MENGTSSDERERCQWVVDEALRQYHDTEWGTTPTTNQGWLEFIILETFQAGLSWRTILHKRTAFRRAMADFHPLRLAAYTENDVARLLQDDTIVRNRKKIEAAVANARIATHLIDEFGSLSAYFSTVREQGEVLGTLQRQFRFVGKTTAESIAFATGLLPPPHEAKCFLFRG